MTTARASRPISIVLTMLVAFFSALAALAVSNGMDMAQAHSTHAAPTSRAVTLRLDMRKLWEDHITWTRLAIVSLTTGSPDTEATVGRLLQNQTDIGKAITPYYGGAAGTGLTKELRAHILIAADVIAAAKAGDATKLADAQARWTRNADEIASFLHEANPHSWPLGEMRAMMHRHLELTTREVVARLHADWSADVAAYDQVHLQILRMADMLTAGIVEQFPNRFR